MSEEAKRVDPQTQQLANDLGLVCDLALKGGGLQAKASVDRVLQAFDGMMKKPKAPVLVPKD